MNSLAEAIQDVVTVEPAEVPHDAATADNSIEPELAREIAALWSDHILLSGDRRATSKELRQIRARLAERLAAMKVLLSHAGRSGQWRSWLKERGIPRSSADRLVARHGKTVETRTSGNAPAGATMNLSGDAAVTLARCVWLRHGRNLGTYGTVVKFLASLAKLAGVDHDWRDEGLMILLAPAGPPESGTDDEPPIEPASPSSDETAGVAAESPEPAECGQVAVAEEGRGAERC